MKKIIRKTFGLIFFLIGISILLYPLVQKISAEIHQTKAIVDYEGLKKIDEQILREAQEKKRADEYNKALRETNQFLTDLTNKTEVSFFDGLEVGEMIGIINIPKANVYLPIYHGTTDEVLAKGIGHIENSSMPGEIGTHCVLTGHTGLTSNKMFDNIINMQEGDTFFIQYNNENLAYKVTQIKIVLPSDTQSIILYDDQELVTLVTCYPKYVNTHRLLVTGTRVELSDIDIDDYEMFTPEQILALKKTKSNFSILLVVLLAVILIYFVFIRKPKKKRKKKQKRYTRIG